MSFLCTSQLAQFLRVHDSWAQPLGALNFTVNNEIAVQTSKPSSEHKKML